MNSIETLSEIFAHFPGIGPRQAKRFVYYLLSRREDSIESLVDAIQNLKKDINQCTECMRFFAGNTAVCNICSGSHRDKSLLMLVPRDADLDAVEKSGSFKGLYFVLGGSVPILEKEPEKRIRLRNLDARIKRDAQSIKELILAMNATAEGENTADFLKERYKTAGFPISELGRGLSTGS